MLMLSSWARERAKDNTKMWLFQQLRSKIYSMRKHPSVSTCTLISILLSPELLTKFKFQKETPSRCTLTSSALISSSWELRPLKASIQNNLTVKITVPKTKFQKLSWPEWVQSLAKSKFRKIMINMLKIWLRKWGMVSFKIRKNLSRQTISTKLFLLGWRRDLMMKKSCTISNFKLKPQSLTLSKSISFTAMKQVSKLCRRERN